MKKLSLALMAFAALSFVACNPSGNEPEENPGALTQKVDPTAENFDRVVLIEQFTAQSCGNCPNGTQAIKNVVAGYDYVWVTHHAGYKDDDFTIAGSKAIASQFGVTGAPSMALNREMQKYHDYSLDASGQPVIGSEMNSLIFHPAYMQGGGISTMFQDAILQEGLASINIKQKMVDGKLKLGVYGAVKELTKVCVNVLIVEDNLRGKQYGPLGSSYGWDESYVHDNVPRAFCSVPLGDAVELDGGTYQKEYEVTLAPTWNKANCKVVVFLTKSNFKTVLNAAEVPVQ